MNFIEAALRRGAYLVATVGLMLLLINALATVLDVLGRALLSKPIDRLSDVSEIIFILAAACCVPAATAQRRHIAIKPFEGRLSARAYAWLESLASLLLLLVWLVVAWQLWVYAAQMAATNQTLSQFRDVRVAPFWQLVAATMSFNAVLEATNLSRLLATAMGWIEPAPTATADPTDAPNLL